MFSCLPVHPEPGTEPETWSCALIRNLAGNLSMHRISLNQISHTGQETLIFMWSIQQTYIECVLYTDIIRYFTQISLNLFNSLVRLLSVICKEKFRFREIK